MELKNEDCAQTIRGIAHDFNNLLAVISGNAQICIDRYRDDKFAHEVFCEIFDASERAMSLSRKLRLLAGDKLLEEGMGDGSASEENVNLIEDSNQYAPDGGENETILIIDDDKKVLDITERSLASAGYNAIAAEGGEEGITIFKSRADEISLVVLDIMMPDVNGLEVFKAIKGIRPDVKVVICSGYSMDGMAKEMMDGGAKAFVQKPFKVARICEVVKQVLDL